MECKFQIKIWSYFSAKLLLYIIYIIVIIYYYYYYNKICKVRFMSVCFSVRPPHFALIDCWGVMSCRIIILSSNPKQIRLGGGGGLVPLFYYSNNKKQEMNQSNCLNSLDVHFWKKLSKLPTAIETKLKQQENEI